jgi:hypothetical protein
MIFIFITGVFAGIYGIIDLNKQENLCELNNGIFTYKSYNLNKCLINNTIYEIYYNGDKYILVNYGGVKQ